MKTFKKYTSIKVNRSMRPKSILYRTVPFPDMTICKLKSCYYANTTTGVAAGGTDVFQF